MKQERLNLERPYSPECVEGEFHELHLNGVLRSSLRTRFSKKAADRAARPLTRYVRLHFFG